MGFFSLLSIPRQPEAHAVADGFREVAPADSRTKKLSGRGPTAAPVYPVRARSGAGLNNNWLCPKCGTINEADISVCKKCGHVNFLC